METKRVYCFDIDGTICTRESPDNYGKAKPFQNMIQRINELYDKGHTVYFFTARHMLREPVTKEWFLKHNVKHHHIYFGKPVADMYVDDLGVSPEDFLNNK